MKKEVRNTAIELTTCGDTREYGAIVWFGTHSEKAALSKMRKLAKEISELNLKKFPRSIK